MREWAVDAPNRCKCHLSMRPNRYKQPLAQELLLDTFESDLYPTAGGKLNRYTDKDVVLAYRLGGVFLLRGRHDGKK